MPGSAASSHLCPGTGTMGEGPAEHRGVLDQPSGAEQGGEMVLSCSLSPLEEPQLQGPTRREGKGSEQSSELFLFPSEAKTSLQHLWRGRNLCAHLPIASGPGADPAGRFGSSVWGDPGRGGWRCPPRSISPSINIKSMPLPCPACGHPAAKSFKPLTPPAGREGEDRRIGDQDGGPPLQPLRMGPCNLGPHSLS